MKGKATANRPVDITGCIYLIYPASLGTWEGFHASPVPSPDRPAPEGCFLCFCALMKYYYRTTSFHPVHISLSLYSRAHTYAPGDAYISTLLHSSEQDSDKGKVIYRNAHHLAVTCAGGTHSYIFDWYLFSMPFAFC